MRQMWISDFHFLIGFRKRLTFSYLQCWTKVLKCVKHFFRVKNLNPLVRIVRTRNPTLQVRRRQGLGKCSCGTRLVWRVWEAPLVQIYSKSFILDWSLEHFCHHLLKTTSQGIITYFLVLQLYLLYWAPYHCKRISDCPICVLLVLHSAKISDCALKQRITELILLYKNKVVKWQSG